MNIRWLLLCLLALASTNNVETSVQPRLRFLNPNAIIRQVFEMLRSLIINGGTDEVPVLDPLEFESRAFQICLPDKLLTLNGHFTNGIIRGLSDFELLEVEFVKSEIAVELSIYFPLVTLAAEKYEMKGNIYEAIPLAGNGTFQFEITDFILRTKIYLKQSEDGQSIIIDRFHESNFSVKKISSHTEYDKNFDDILNALIDDRLAEYLTRFSEFILTKYSGAVVNYVNPFLEQYETWRFIAAIL